MMFVQLIGIIPGPSGCSPIKHHSATIASDLRQRLRGSPKLSRWITQREISHVHISENHRGVPGTGHVYWADTFRGLKACGYDGWLTIEAFGRALPELAAAMRIWRDLFDSEEDVAVQGLAFKKRMWDGE